MQSVPLHRDTWAIAVADSGLRLEEIAVLTGKSYSAVYRYKTGSRTPPLEWLVQVSAVLAKRRLDIERGAAS